MGTIKTNHDFPGNSQRCVACGLMIKNLHKKPGCKTLKDGPIREIDPYKQMAKPADRSAIEALNRGPVKASTTFHKFEQGKCTVCDLRSTFEFRYPTCPAPEGAQRETTVKPTQSKSYGKGGGKSEWKARCYESHPALPIGEHNVYGGSCSSPIVKDADIYIGFDFGMKITHRSLPWKRGSKGFAEEVYFHVRDFAAPKAEEAEEYVALVEWSLKQVKAGLKVHAGCIGGHGRTGMFLAALCAKAGIENPIAYVREHYCQKAVESPEQVKFLHKHFGCEADAVGAKSHSGGAVASPSKPGKWKWDNNDTDWWKSEKKAKAKDDSTLRITPKPKAGNVWGSTLDENL